MRIIRQVGPFSRWTSPLLQRTLVTTENPTLKSGTYHVKKIQENWKIICFNNNKKLKTFAGNSS